MGDEQQERRMYGIASVAHHSAVDRCARFSFFRSGYMNVALEQTEEYVDGQLKVSSSGMRLHCVCGR